MFDVEVNSSSVPRTEVPALCRILNTLRTLFLILRRLI